MLGFANHVEGVADNHKNLYLVFGRNVDARSGQNGFYVAVYLRFFKKIISDWVSPVTYRTERRLCFPAFRIVCRKPARSKRFSVFSSGIIWVPSEAAPRA